MFDLDWQVVWRVIVVVVVVVVAIFFLYIFYMYFDQWTGASQAVLWSKSAFLAFKHANGEKSANRDFQA